MQPAHKNLPTTVSAAHASWSAGEKERRGGEGTTKGEVLHVEIGNASKCCIFTVLFCHAMCSVFAYLQKIVDNFFFFYPRCKPVLTCCVFTEVVHPKNSGHPRWKWVSFFIRTDFENLNGCSQNDQTANNLTIIHKYILMTPVHHLVMWKALFVRN